MCPLYLNLIPYLFFLFPGGAADHLANEIIKSEGLKSDAAHKARLALIQGKAKFQNFNGVLQTCEDVKANGGKLDTLGYNALILATANQKRSSSSHVFTIFTIYILIFLRNFIFLLFFYKMEVFYCDKKCRYNCLL